jgi:hypothetical protein
VFNLPIKSMDYYNPLYEPFYNNYIQTQTALDNQVCDRQSAKDKEIDDNILYREGYLGDHISATYDWSPVSWSLDLTTYPYL